MRFYSHEWLVNHVYLCIAYSWIAKFLLAKSTKIICRWNQHFCWLHHNLSWWNPHFLVAEIPISHKCPWKWLNHGRLQPIHLWPRAIVLRVVGAKFQLGRETLWDTMIVIWEMYQNPVTPAYHIFNSCSWCYKYILYIYINIYIVKYIYIIIYT